MKPYNNHTLEELVNIGVYGATNSMNPSPQPEKSLGQIASGLSDALWNNPDYTDAGLRKFYEDRGNAIATEAIRRHEAEFEKMMDDLPPLALPHQQRRMRDE